MLTSNDKGNIAETAIAFEAVELVSVSSGRSPNTAAMTSPSISATKSSECR